MATDTSGTVPSRPVRQRPPAAERPPRHVAIDVACMVLLSVAASTALVPAFAARPLLVTALVAAALGAAVALAGRRWRLNAAVTAGLAVLGYLLVGPALLAPHATVAGVLPTPTAWREVLAAAVRSWRDVATLVPPLEGRAALLAVPFLLAMVAALLAVTIALRTSRPWWALLPIGAAMAGAILLGTRDATGMAVRGAIVGATAIGWAAWRWKQAAPAVALVGRTRSRTVPAAVSLTAAAATAFALAPVTQPDTARYVVREHVVPPFDVRDYVSPLQSYRAWVRDLEDTLIFTVSGLPADGRLRLAAMDGYDGTVYDVTDGPYGGSFVPVVSELPTTPPDGAEVEVRITVEAYTGVWVPTAGHPREITFTGADADQQTRGLHYDSDNGVAVTTAQLRPGDTLTVSGVLEDVPTDDQLADRPGATVRQPDLENVATIVSAAAAEYAGSAESALQTARNLETTLSQGYFSHGLEGQPASRSGHGADRISAFLSSDQLLGDDEQYAVTMALMARQLGLPARVVMGFVAPDGSGPLTGADLRVWPELAFETYGWVPFDPTPDEDDEPQDSTSDPRSNPQPQVLQPPPPPQEPAQEPPIAPQEDTSAEDEDDEQRAGAPTWLWVAGGTAVVLALAAAPFLLVLAAKARRRRRRRASARAADSAAGSWNEVVDTATDLGTQLPRSTTRQQAGLLLQREFTVPGATLLAARTDVLVFGAGEADAAAVASAWEGSQRLRRQLLRSVGWRRRQRARFALRSLRARRDHGRASRRSAPGSTPEQVRPFTSRTTVEA